LQDRLPGDELAERRLVVGGYNLAGIVSLRLPGHELRLTESVETARTASRHVRTFGGGLERAGWINGLSRLA
jgi:hypothetical protein